MGAGSLTPHIRRGKSPSAFFPRPARWPFRPALKIIDTETSTSVLFPAECLDARIYSNGTPQWKILSRTNGNVVSQSSVLIRAGVTGYELDDETVLFLEHTGELLRLNPTAALVWRGLKAGLSSHEIIDSLVQVAGSPATEVAQDVAALMTGFQEAGVLGAPPPSRLRSPSHRHAHSRERCYRLVDFQFRLKTPPAIEREAYQLLAHLSLPDSSSPEVLLEVLEDGNQWLLLREGRVVDQCPTPAGIVPMLHSNILLMAYWSSGCMAALHAAAVTRGGDCILMPAASGSGKTTFTAALLSQGFGYCTDDLALLTHEPVRIRPVPTCLGLKPGSWGVVDDVFPEIRQLRTYLRSDGKQVRYLPPPRVDGARDSYRARAIVFPAWSPGHTAEIRSISSVEGLSRLTASGYDLPNRINRDIVECLIRWISGLPCFELRYDAPGDAVPMMSALMP
jgi:hypothetical protein